GRGGVAAAAVGAEGGRVAVGRFEGGGLTVDEVLRFPNEPIRANGTLRWNATGLYRSVLDGLRAVGRRVDSVAVDSWGVDFGLLDEKDRLVQGPVHYRQPRPAAAVREAPRAGP